MPLTIADAEDSYLDASARIDQWMREFEAEWYEPLGKMQLAMMMATLPDEVKAQLEAMNPEAYKNFQDLLGGE